MHPALIPLAATVFCFAVFLVSFLLERRRLRNGFYLFFALAFLGLTLISLLASLSPEAAAIVAFGLFALIPLTIVVLAVFLIGNGVIMLRREGRRPANLLSLAAGVGIVALIVFGFVVGQIRWAPLEALRDGVDGIVAYLSFLFVCFLLYSLVYGRVRSRRPLDFVVVLGSGLLGGKNVPPLLASRLDRGRRVLDAEDRKGRSPLLVTSGGQGPGEDVPESHAMADYLVDRGVPRERIVLEDRSRTTRENLAFSAGLMCSRKPGYRCVVVTNNFHVLRAALTARKVKVNGQVIGSRTAWYFWPSATLREFAAILDDHRILNGIVCAVIIAASLLKNF
ncbi:YdcF family protein [Amycolatopsis sp. OK19-0408]|uniref:YdcF family protein n=1 Tax=Amycolatopsis iheyensis TaxID=2945988 RepID=A0A9X2NHP3_9PSEU|nr:YdcF family protein [Amycolatopsis iheyensis]MCR6487443.1 YdcF family protein [Amycolatopsis iheyensis]